MSERIERQQDFGEYLRHARERRGVSLRQVAVSTKISVNALEALERNDISRLPGGIFSRAFVRSYAVEVGLDPEATVGEFLGHFPDESPSDGPVHEHATDLDLLGQPHDTVGVLVKLAGLSIPVILLIVYLTMSGGGSASSPPESGRGTAAVDTDLTPSTERPPPASRPLAQGAERPRVDSVPASEPAAPRTANAEAGVGRRDTPLTAAALTIEIAPNGSCWVSMSADGERVISRLMEAGDRLVQRADRELVLNIGDAGRFAYSINGRAGRTLGAEGEVIRVRIDSQNYRTFIR